MRERKTCIFWQWYFIQWEHTEQGFNMYNYGGATHPIVATPSGSGYCLLCFTLFPFHFISFHALLPRDFKCVCFFALYFSLIPIAVASSALVVAVHGIISRQSRTLHFGLDDLDLPVFKSSFRACWQLAELEESVSFLQLIGEEQTLYHTQEFMNYLFLFLKRGENWKRHILVACLIWEFFASAFIYCWNFIPLVKRWNNKEAEYKLCEERYNN